MTKKGRRDRHEVTRQILRYLIEHPDAKDTIQGIMKWWLAGTGPLLTEESLQKVLDAGVARGWLAERKSPSGRIYGLNKSLVADVRNFLQEPHPKRAVKFKDC